ncbi:fructose transport system permease protein [Tistlia consotensis]|uniref:Mannose ABC transporter membrane protein /fructose ABC transporter membrane protein /ribose ABC transporter membrane protein n=1 Tax=Tistlia consotensis USBA 355 TaxID=560819 RepID=A0A1Y6C0N5_9PROT|nr:ABC transporter permease [Tistlia consotensis]SMF29507.1 mannose ABC transporter membrane protein /fructose ABC transporter membrane protein /ribose ABC transporter membrane protein [Tistlia consotensis USBA 355]SNR91218.1 fructose transport system permease protein [Tistlia consotensis]
MAQARDMQDFEKAAGTGGEVARFEAVKRSPLQQLHHFLHVNPTAVPIVVLALSVAVFGTVAGNFFTAFNMTLIIQQVTIIGVLGVAQTLIILTAGIDLSVAAIMVLSSVVMGSLAVNLGVPTLVAIPVGLLIGVLCGAFNGVLVTLFRLPPFIVTLGAWKIFFALNLWLSGGESIRSQDIDAAAPLLKFWGDRFALGGAQFTGGAILMLLLFGLFWFLLNKTAWGRHVYAIGDDRDAATLSGIPTGRVLISVYVVAGFLCALGAWVAIGRVGSVSPQSFYEGNLDAITAVVIGGCSLFGGRGSILGTLVGALIVGVFRSGLNLSGVDVLWQQFAVGALIIVAVAIDQWLRKVSP